MEGGRREKPALPLSISLERREEEKSHCGERRRGRIGENRER